MNTSTFFNGVDERVDLGNDSNFYDWADIRALSIWFKNVTITTANQSMWSYGRTQNPDEARIELNVDGSLSAASGKIVFNLEDSLGATTSIASNSGIYLGSSIWTHVVVAQTLSGYEMWVNAILQTDTTNPSLTFNSEQADHQGFIGARKITTSPYDQHWHGNISQIAFLRDTPVNQAKVDELYGNGSGVDLTTVANLKYAWNMGSAFGHTDVFPIIDELKEGSTSGIMQNMAADDFVVDFPGQAPPAPSGGESSIIMSYGSAGHWW